MAETPFSKAWLAWFESPEGQKACDVHTMEYGNSKYLVNRLHTAFSAGWRDRPETSAAPYESSTIAIGSDAGYQAFHEAVQEGWEPMIHWRDDHGDHFMMRRLRHG